jgi:tetratricopeptide (TPR) repeat protein
MAVWFNLGTTRLRLHDTSGAVRALRKAAGVASDFPYVHQVLGEALESDGDVLGAIDHYRRVLRENREEAGIHVNLGDLLRRLGRHEDAQKHLDEALGLAPEAANVHCCLGYLRLDQGRPQAARKRFLSALELAEDFGRAKRGLEAAERMIRHAPVLEAVLRGEEPPADANDVAMLGWLAHLQGRNAAATRLLGFALESDDSPTRGVTHHFRRDAVRPAVLAGLGVGSDATGLEEAERAEMRARALAWMQAELEHFGEHLEGADAAERIELRGMLVVWQHHAFLAGVRDEVRLRKLAEEERGSWRALWSEVAAAVELTRPEDE